MISATWHTDGELRLVINQKASEPWRLAIGAPLLAAGAFLLYLFVSAPVANFMAAGWQGVLDGVPGMLVSLLLGLCTGPIGWWIVLARLSVIVDPARSEIQEVFDWRLGRKVKRRDARLFERVRVGRELLTDPSTQSRSAHRTYGNVVRLIPRHGATASLSLAIFDDKETAKPTELGRLIADMLRLPIEVDFENTAPSPDEEDEAN